MPEPITSVPPNDSSQFDAPVVSHDGKLFVVGTPIGNLDDLTLRAVATLRAADIIYAEDTRRTRALLSHLGITKKALHCLDAHARESTLEQALSAVRGGQQVALVTDAGTPAVSDPGTALVRRCHAAGLRVVPIPGPSAVTAAIAASGLVEQGFWFVGFLPRKGSKRQALLQRIQHSREAVVLFEAPARMPRTLCDLAHLMPERLACVGREMTKRFEEIRTHTLAQWCAEPRSWRGELTLVLASCESAPERSATDDETARREAIVEARQALQRGNSVKQLAVEVAERTGLSRRVAYQLVLAEKNRANSE